jgi:hypothetical protein
MEVEHYRRNLARFHIVNSHNLDPVSGNNPALKVKYDDPF